MLVIKFDKQAVSGFAYSKMLNNLATNSIAKLFRRHKLNIIDDSKSIEMICSQESNDLEEIPIIELSFKKTIKISKEFANDKQAIDKLMLEIENFCEHSSKIDNYSYLPLNMRTNKKDATK